MKKISFKSVNLQLLVVFFLFVALNVAIYLTGRNADNRNRAAPLTSLPFTTATPTKVPCKCVYDKTNVPAYLACMTACTGFTWLDTPKKCQISSSGVDPCGQWGMECHCQDGNICNQTACEPPTQTHEFCRQAGRQWCTNVGGYAMTCCEPGYICSDAPGCYLAPKSTPTAGAGGVTASAPTTCPVTSSISCRPMTDTNPNFRCKMVTELNSCGVMSYTIGDNCCPTNTPTILPPSPTPTTCQATSTISCKPMTDPNVNYRCKYVTETNTCGTITVSIGGNCCPTNTPTRVPTATPTVCVVPTAPYCPNGQLVSVPITPGGMLCSQYACINKDPTPTRIPTATPTVCVMPTPPVCTNGTLVQVPITPGGSICSQYRCIPNTPTPTRVPTLPVSSTCRVSFDLPHQAVCWRDPIKSYPVTLTVHSLPSTGGPYYVQTDWQILLPTEGPHHYDWTQLAVVGKTYTVYADWPGIPAGYNGTVENHVGVNIVDRYGNPISPVCGGGIDYYWTPYVNCPATTATRPVCNSPVVKQTAGMTCDGGTNGSLTWYWNSVLGSDQYEIDIYKSDGTKVVDNGWMAGSSFGCASGTCKLTTNLPAGSYYSMVRTQATNGCGPSNWTRSATTTLELCSPVSCNKNLDIAFVVDRSGGMAKYTEANGLTKLQMAKAAVGKAIGAIKASGTSLVRVSAVSFGGQGNDGKGTLPVSYNSTLNLSLTNNYTVATSAVNNIAYIQDLSCIQCGLKIANQQLSSTVNKKVVVLLSDGIANRSWDGTGNNSSYPVANANAMNEALGGRSRGVEYRVVGYGDKMLGTTVDGGINEAVLRSIAGVSTNYLYSPTPDNWTNQFIQIVRDLCK